LDEFEQNRFREKRPQIVYYLAVISFGNGKETSPIKILAGIYTNYFIESEEINKPMDSILKDSTYAQNTGFSANINSIRNHPFSVVFTYRELEIKKCRLNDHLKPDNTLLSQNRIFTTINKRVYHIEHVLRNRLWFRK
jgi:hypothetical protein